MSLRDELLAVRAEYGRLTRENVVLAATPEDHPLHGELTWDDSIAGHRYRLIQAGELIRRLRVTYVDPAGHPESVRAFHAVARPAGMAYEPADEVAADDLASKILLQSMEREWRQLKARYDRFAEFREMIRRDLDAA